MTLSPSFGIKKNNKRGEKEIQVFMANECHCWVQGNGWVILVELFIANRCCGHRYWSRGERRAIEKGEYRKQVQAWHWDSESMYFLPICLNYDRKIELQNLASFSTQFLSNLFFFFFGPRYKKITFFDIFFFFPPNFPRIKRSF